MSIKKDDRASKKYPECPPEPTQNDGAFKRPTFAKTVTSLIGNNVKVKTKTGSTYEGVFSTLSSDLDVVVELSQAIHPEDLFYDRVVNDSILFKPEDIVSISCVNVNLDALDLPQMLDMGGDCPSRIDEVEDQHKDRGKGWTADLLPTHRSNFESTNQAGSYLSIYTGSDFSRGSELDYNQSDDLNRQNFDRDCPKPPRNSTDGALEGFSSEGQPGKTSNLNPYAKPFTPLEAPNEKESTQISSLAAVVLPAYVVPGNPPSKLEAAPQQGLSGGVASLLGGGSSQNQFMQFPYGDYDEKLYSSYDSLPISAHDYQQYYPHLQYIQYFRRFY